MATTDGPTAPAGTELDTGFFGHPRGLSTLFFTEMWERFSYYGMRALLVLFMTAAVAQGGMGLDTATAGPIYGMYTALVYLLALPGGWFADRVLGQQRAVFWGGVLIMCGHISLAMEGFNLFLLGLFLVVMGTGLLKPNISTIVGQLYSPEDARRDAGFSIFYMGINLGGFLAPLVTSFLAQHPAFRAMLESWGMDPNRAWHWGFGAAAVGMFFGLIWYTLGRKHLYGAGSQPNDPLSEGGRRVAIGVLAALLVGGALMFLAAGPESVSKVVPIQAAMTWVLVAVTVAFFAWLFTAGSHNADERRRHVTIFVLFLAASIFWAAFEQAGSTLNLFAERSTRREFLGFNISSGMWQSVNSLFIVLLAPVFAWLWIRLGRREPSSPAKFSWGLLIVGLGFVLMVPAGGTAVKLGG